MCIATIPLNELNISLFMPVWGNKKYRAVEGGKHDIDENEMLHIDGMMIEVWQRPIKWLCCHITAGL